MSENNYKSIIERLSDTQNSISRWQAFEGLADLLAFLSGFVFILWIITGLFWPDPALRVILLIIGIAGALSLIGLYVLKPLIKKLPLSKIALRLEKHYGKLQSRLIASLELYDKLKVNKENYSIELIEKTIEETGEEIKDLDFNAAVQKKTIPYKRLALSVLAVVFAFAVSSRTISNVGLLYSHPFADIPKPTNLQLILKPLSYTAIKNDDVAIKIIAAGEKTRRVDFNFKFDDGKWIAIPAERQTDDTGDVIYGDSVFTYTFKKVKRDIEYYARAKNVESSIGKITVIDPPNLVDVSITLDYPDYTRLQTETLPNNDGSVTALKGTRVMFKGKMNKPAQTADMVFNSNKRKKMTVDGKQLSGKFALNKSGSYHIEITDSSGLNNRDPIKFDLVCLDDYPPQVQITFPAVDVDLDESMTLPIDAALYDDFGFTKLELVYWTFSEGRESSKKREVLKESFGNLNEALFTYNWFIEKLYLLPGDLVYYYLELFDNDIISGPKSSVSKTYSARLPSIDEIMADITGQQEEIFVDFEETVANQKELKKELEQLSREMLKLSEVDWEKKQQIQHTIDRQKDIAEKLEQMAEQIDDAIEKFEKNEMATMEMLDKMEELRNLMEEVATPELKEAMKKLQEALQKMDPELLKEAMKNFEMSVEQTNENLDRMLALLKKYQLEQKIDMLAKLSEKLAQQQEQINDKLSQCQKKDDVSKCQSQQKQQEQGLENLKEQFEQAKQLNDQLDMIPKQDMEKADQQVNSPELSKKMSEMMQSLGMCSSKNACKKGGQLQQDFNELAQMFQQMMEQMQSQQQQMITGMIKKAIADILYLSHNQEDVINSTKEDIKRLEGRREAASQQKDIETAADRVAQNVSDITKETLFVNFAVMERLGAALTSMQEAIDKLNSRHPGKAENNQVEAMSALNQSVSVLMKALDEVSQCQSSSCSGMQSLMQKLNQMGKQQMNINQQSQMMMPMPGQMLSMAQKQGMQRLAAQQEAIRKGLQELTEELGSSGNILGRIDQLGEEMKKVSQDLQNQNLNRNTIKRQERILSRLLDAQKSVHRRDHSRKRQARTADDIIRRGPEALNFGNMNNEKLAEDIKKALTEKYPKRYERQIKEYFKALTKDSAIE
ncbi:MAG: hypothetical protein J7K40_12690 [candidate division Zixibacteria bacterium]|nr:hypothetical protein [candidate division Zixibacteria bacterium]